MKTLTILGFILILTATIQAQLRVTNGDFSDISGLKPLNDGWHSGLTKGWTGSAGSYGIDVSKGDSKPTCNPSELGLLRQTVGTLKQTSDVTITFDVSEPWNKNVVLNATILDKNLNQFASGNFKSGKSQHLTAPSVPSGTTIVIAFLAINSTPGLDNVTVSEMPNSKAAIPKMSTPKITVASYYFGNYHPGDARNTKMPGKGKDWSEWELVKNAKPRFPGHQQPNIPLWGYTDESNPKAMEQKIAAAADHGIDAFIFDWYYYNDGPFLEGALDSGFLHAKNNKRLKFALMWANHDWLEIHPYKRGTPQPVLFPGQVTPENFDKICDHIIRKYFLHPSYLKIDGKPYFSFYELTKLLDSFGSVKATRVALDRFRAKAIATGLKGIHLNAVVWGQPILPGEQKPVDAAQLVNDLGFDSVTSYVWIHHVGLPKQQTDYDEVRNGYLRYWDEAVRKFSLPYYPNVTMGWDSSPRANQTDAFGNFGYPFMNTIGGNTPDRFREALLIAKQRLLANPNGPRMLNINCWNEWTEGSYLEPNQRNGYKFLEAIRDIFPTKPKRPY
jgi:hypothetical protein